MIYCVANTSPWLRFSSLGWLVGCFRSVDFSFGRDTFDSNFTSTAVFSGNAYFVKAKTNGIDSKPNFGANESWSRVPQ